MTKPENRQVGGPGLQFDVGPVPSPGGPVRFPFCQIMPMIKTVLAGAVLLGAMALGLGHVRAQNDLFQSWSASGTCTPFFVGSEQEPSMMVSVDTVRPGCERKGFFRIGILPIVVMDGVTIEVRKPEALRENLVHLDRWLSERDGKRLEIRNAKLLFCASMTNTLEAGCVKIVPGGKWELLDGVRFSSGTNQVRADHAFLQITGPASGSLVLGSMPGSEILIPWNWTGPSGGGPPGGGPPGGGTRPTVSGTGPTGEGTGPDTVVGRVPQPGVRGSGIRSLDDQFVLHPFRGSKTEKFK